MRAFFQSHGGEDSIRPSSLFSSLPKIMGLDYIIDASLQPWLMEVNRFPGLEARGPTDYNVKTHVVADAWRLASRLSNIECGLSFEELDGTVQELTL